MGSKDHTGLRLIEHFSGVHICGTTKESRIRHMSFPLMNRDPGLLLIVMSLLLSSCVTDANSQVPNIVASPIQEARFLTLGSIEQWITIRGANRANPVLLVVHGG